MEYEKIKGSIFDLIFPKNCFGCEKEGKWFCPDCGKKIKFINTQVCYLCRRVSPNGKVCPRCRPKSKLIGVVIMAAHSGILRKALASFKYEGLFDVAGELSEFLTKAIETHLPKGDYLLMPIPLYKQKFNERGFNQSEILAEKIRKKFDWQMNLDLKKIKPTLPQVGMKRKARLENIKDSFAFLSSRAEPVVSLPNSPRDLSLAGKKILLVDDVLTTGATLEEAARVLKSAGARSVWSVVLCRG